MAEWNGLSRADRTRFQVGEPEGTSVIKAGVCWYAQSGRRTYGAKPGGTAEVFTASVPAEKLGTEAFYFVPQYKKRS